MLYCDLSIDGTAIFTGVACLNLVPLNARTYIGLAGNLGFLDTQGTSDPTWDGLGTRYVLCYQDSGIDADGDVEPSDVSIIPLDAVPSQSLTVTLDGFNCALSVYERAPQ